MTIDLAAIEAERERIKQDFLLDSPDRPESSAQGLHHFALLCSDVRRTIEFYQGVLEFPLTVMTGTNDTKTTGRYFPKGPRSMRQGAHRHERAHNYVRAGHAAADALGTRCAWTVINVPDVGHDGEQMSVAAAPVVAAALHASETVRTIAGASRLL